MINLITAPPGVGKTLFAVTQLHKAHQQNISNIPKSKQYYFENLAHLASNLDKTLVVDLVEFKGNQNLFTEIRTALQPYDGKTISLEDYFACFNHYDFTDFTSDKVTPKHYYLSTAYNLIANYANKVLDLKFKMIPAVRQIYSDINGLRLDDVLESPDDWRDCPDGSIIFYDEVQNRSVYKNTKEKNPIVQDLTIHRHRGFDIWFITQFPTLIHTELRAVVGQHYHLFRPWGLPQAYVHVWSYSVVDPNSFSKKRAAERTFRFTYDKKMFKKYTSSTMHTHKINLPKKLLVYAGGICLGLYMMFNGISGGTIFNEGTDTVKKEEAQGLLDKVDNAKNSNPYSSSNNGSLSSFCRNASNVDKPECVKWFDDLSKNNQSVSSNGSISSISYDPNDPFNSDIQKQVKYEITSKPVFSGCIEYNNQYYAFTEQGTRLKVSSADCKKVIENGDRPYNYFVNKEEDRKIKSENNQGDNQKMSPQDYQIYLQYLRDNQQAKNEVQPNLIQKMGANQL